MRAFEKWRKKQRESKSNTIVTMDCHKCSQFVWKAALEWVLKQMEKHYPDDFDAFDVVKGIKKELRNMK